MPEASIGSLGMCCKHTRPEAFCPNRISENAAVFHILSYDPSRVHSFDQLIVLVTKLNDVCRHRLSMPRQA